ncbi:LLM class flavin-dependent oxidoreductase [Rhodococcus pseudokoreensis]|uniref:LLM class flavin-dependent oxidoreductase n=1 Tax=Rhodococcus pseudokoreensis TaxID=2811421 RepID=A0A974WBN7_9NOCA|nr:LLM class flavin-dependent oxidoreductase [Rhodococcus pseudokoreensis]QSE94744.1 LLM class flavin-dependent oxidoreductase [Rhodococcus pseudokoreensis]
MAQPVPRFGLWYDFRNPPRWEQPAGALYRETLAQIGWAEQLGFGSVWLSEHHFADDAYASSPLVIAGAVGQATSSMRIGTNILVAPLHDPVRVAEDSAALSLMTGGRFELGVGLGYHVEEFEAFGRKVAQRTSLLEESIDVMRRAWSGSVTPYQGRRFTLPALAVTPVPESAPRLLIGAQSAGGIDRAARLADGLITLKNDDHRVYLDAVQRHRRSIDDARIYASQWAIIADDPEKVWSEVGERALYQLNRYIAHGAFGPPESTPLFADPDAVLAAGTYRLLDADTAVDEFVAMVQACPQIRDIHVWAQLPGEPVESGSARIEYIANKVIPQVSARLEAAAAG